MANQSNPREPTALLVLGYGVFAYLVFLLTVLYYVGFLANVGVPHGIDEGPTVSLVPAIAINTGLLVVFGVQHSVMARSWFKDRWTRIIPTPIERSTYVLASAIALLALALFWQPITTVVWDVTGIGEWVLWGGYGVGILLVVVSTFQISHASLFGLEQVRAYYRGEEFSPPAFQTPGLYRFVRHPLMTGFFLWFWVTPHMTVGHLLFAGGMSIYILVGTHLEEQMLLQYYGQDYADYRRTVPRFFPRPGRSRTARSPDSDRSQE